MVLELEVLEYQGPARWRWRLTEPGGRFLADHEVRLDPGAAEYEAFTDLQGYLRWHAAPDRRSASAAEIVDRVGRWIGEAVLGPVGPALVAEAPATVRPRAAGRGQGVGLPPVGTRLG